MSQLINQYKGNIGAYFAVHSYSQLWMYPWGYTYSLTSNSADLVRIRECFILQTAYKQLFATLESNILGSGECNQICQWIIIHIWLYRQHNM